MLYSFILPYLRNDKVKFYFSNEKYNFLVTRSFVDVTITPLPFGVMSSERRKDTVKNANASTDFFLKTPFCRCP